MKLIVIAKPLERVPYLDLKVAIAKLWTTHQYFKCKGTLASLSTCSVWECYTSYRYWRYKNAMCSQHTLLAKAPALHMDFAKISERQQ